MTTAKEIIESFQSSLNFSELVKKEAQELFSQYCRGQDGPLSDESLQLFSRLALFTASRAVPFQSEVKNSATHITMSQILELPPKTKPGSFIQGLKHFLGYVKLPISAYSELKFIISYFAFLLTIYKKFDSILSRFEPINEVENVKTIGWLLYAAVKGEVCGKSKNIVEFTCLLIPLLELLIASNPKAFGKVEPGIPLRQQICDLFQIKLGAAVEKICCSFQTAVLHIIQPLEFAHSLEDFTAIWESPKLNKLEELLQDLVKNGPYPDIDESIFVKEKVEFNNSLFVAQKVINVHVTPINLSSQLKSPMRGMSKVSPGGCEVMLNRRLRDVPLEGYNIPCRTVVNELTPITTSISTNNWLLDCLAKPQLNDGSFSTYLNKMIEAFPEIKSLVFDLTVSEAKEITNIIELDAKSMNLPEIAISEQIRLLYFFFIEEVLTTEEKRTKKLPSDNIIRKEEFHRGLFVAACETIFFIHSMLNIKFEELLEMTKISAFGFWKIIPSFLRLDPPLPFMVIQHFQELEKKIISILAWEKGSPVSHLLARFFAQSPSSENLDQERTVQNTKGNATLTSAERTFAIKTLQFVASSLTGVCAEMKVTDNALTEHVWEAMKHCLATEPELLVDRNIMILLLCSIYGVCRAVEGPTNTPNPEYQFNNIIKCYLRINDDVKGFLANMFHIVKLDSDRYSTIIEFYNSLYLPKMRDDIFKICKGELLKPNMTTQKGLSINSPLKEALPKKAYIHGYVSQSIKSPLSPSQGMSPKPMLTPKQQTPKQTPKLTPRTQALFVCSETPMQPVNLEQRGENIKSYLRNQILERSTTRAPPSREIRCPIPAPGSSKAAEDNKKKKENGSNNSDKSVA